MTRRKGEGGRNIATYEHPDRERVNNPPVGLVTPDTDRDAGEKTYAHDPHLDPQLSWSGKAEHTSFEVPTVSLHVHERIDPRTIIQAVRKTRDTAVQGSLFATPEENPPLRQAIEFYRHRHNWTNRLIAGDSLLIMHKHLHAEGETMPAEASTSGAEDAAPSARAVVSFGPDHAPMEQRQVARAIEEASHLVPRPAVIVFAAFQFDPQTSKDIDETSWPGVTLLKAQMNADLLTDDLKKKRASNESFWLIGQPDVSVERISQGKDAGKFRISVPGFDYYNTTTGNVESGDADRIALWMLDPDYDGRSLFPRQVFFPMAGAKDGWAKLAKSLGTEIDPSRMAAYGGATSLPFEAGGHGRAAVKIVDDRGVESLKIVELV